MKWVMLGSEHVEKRPSGPSKHQKSDAFLALPNWVANLDTLNTDGFQRVVKFG